MGKRQGRLLQQLETLLPVLVARAEERKKHEVAHILQQQAKAPISGLFCTPPLHWAAYHAPLLRSLHLHIPLPPPLHQPHAR